MFGCTNLNPFIKLLYWKYNQINVDDLSLASKRSVLACRSHGPHESHILTRVIHLMHLHPPVQSTIHCTLLPLSFGRHLWLIHREMQIWTMSASGFAMNIAGDHAQVVLISVFVAVLCLCLVIGHLLEENRWLNESTTAIIIVNFSLFLIEFWVFLIYIFPFMWNWIYVLSILWKSMRISKDLIPPGFHFNQGCITGTIILLLSKGKSSHILRFNEELFFIYLLPPIIFNAG